ncbi:AbrB/MazE/SpoVT family DNA-binding domain-containing protein [Brevundimonas sp.]|uniref:AbrB/MazE/SpoVT family DNA-binding domain-containing protein n=1 Tax=Brevundimonas sp. TaxID=1871086 RepID=UPI00356409A9
MRITSKGQVTIPIAIRERAGLLPHTEVEWVMEGGKVVLKPADGLTRGQSVVARLRGTATNKSMTTDEIMEMTRGPYNDLEGVAVTGVHEAPMRFDRE